MRLLRNLAATFLIWRSIQANHVVAATMASKNCSSSAKHCQARKEDFFPYQLNKEKEIRRKQQLSYRGLLHRSRNSIQDRRKAQAMSGCTLCFDGSTVPDPTLPIKAAVSWTCGELSVFVHNSLAPGENECLDYQVLGFKDCGCPVSPLLEKCALCANLDGSVSTIPDTNRNLPIPGTSFTCQDILFVDRNSTDFSCIKQQEYRDFCGCPTVSTTPAPAPSPTLPYLGKYNIPTLPATLREPSQPPISRTNFTCLLCPDDKPPGFASRLVPYLSTGSSTPIQSNTLPLYDPEIPRGQTCGRLAEEALNATVDECFDIVFPSVAVDIQSFCGCQDAITWDLCSLCPRNHSIQNPFLMVPSAGGLTCLELEEYLRYITNEEACNAIATEARLVCCNSPPQCNVCGNSAITDYAHDKPYPPYGLTCSQLGFAETIGYNLSCEVIQERFGYYCECPNAAKPSCTTCALDGLPPDPSLSIPVLGEGVTCGEISDYASLRDAKTCLAGIASFAVDVSAYCQCPGFQAPNSCSLDCPDGLALNRSALIGDAMGMASWIITCGDMAEFVPFVNNAQLCQTIQSAAEPCCVVNDGTLPTSSPSVAPSGPPTTAPFTYAPATPLPTPGTLPTFSTSAPVGLPSSTSAPVSNRSATMPRMTWSTSVTSMGIYAAVSYICLLL